MATPFNTNAFLADPAGYIGATQLLIDGAPVDKRGAQTQKISVQVQKEDNSTELVTEEIEYSRLTLASCSRTFHLRVDPNGTKVFGLRSGVVGASVPGYYLPWNDGKAYAVQLDGSRDYFATAKVNACCVFISGTRQNPLVIHANYDSPRLEPSKKEVDGLSVDKVFAAYKKHHLKQYTRFYGNMAHRLIDLQMLDSDNAISVYDPEFYLARGGLASVFGVRKADGWKFYFNLQKVDAFVTAELWPAIVGHMP